MGRLADRHFGGDLGLRGSCFTRPKATLSLGCLSPAVGGHDLSGAYAGDMSESVAELPADDAPLAGVADDARRGVATHLTIHGERVAVIMPEGVIEALRDFAARPTDERLAGFVPALLPQAVPWARSLPEADLPVFVSELAEAAGSGRDAPEKVAALIREWRATAEIYADPREAARLRQALQEAREGKATPWEYDDAEFDLVPVAREDWISSSERTAGSTARSKGSLERTWRREWASGTRCVVNWQGYRAEPIES